MYQIVSSLTLHVNVLDPLVFGPVTSLVPIYLFYAMLLSIGVLDNLIALTLPFSSNLPYFIHSVHLFGV